MFRATAAALLLSVTISTASHAQEIGTLITRSAAQVDYADKNAARLLTNRWAKCVVQQSPARIEIYLSMPVGSKASRDMARRFLTGESNCISGSVESRELSVADQVTRGALFEALFVRNFGRDDATDLSQAAPLTYDWAPGAEITPDAQQATALARVGDCMVRKNTGGARQLMRTEPGSVGESQAISGMVPFLGGCLPKGKQYQFSKSLLRGTVAEPLFRLSMAAGKPN
ncbi:hypothetical protein SPAN111604_00485 [Sphingomonas antarctica]|uniref:hypothetical protein n=1 Tax=Sphingomonas antarctica TaxID=2040274 RepID=UPI0039ED84D7